MELNLFEEALKWCDEGLTVSFDLFRDEFIICEVSLASDQIMSTLRNGNHLKYATLLASYCYSKQETTLQMAFNNLILI